MRRRHRPALHRPKSEGELHLREGQAHRRGCGQDHEGSAEAARGMISFQAHRPITSAAGRSGRRLCFLAPPAPFRRGGPAGEVWRARGSTRPPNPLPEAADYYPQVVDRRRIRRRQASLPFRICHRVAGSGTLLALRVAELFSRQRRSTLWVIVSRSGEEPEMTGRSIIGSSPRSAVMPPVRAFRTSLYSLALPSRRWAWWR